MAKIICSKLDIYNENDKKAEAYLNCIKGILDSDEFHKLKNYKHHHFTTRFHHSLNVSYYSYRICKLLGWDYRSAARAGLMHDFYFFDNTSRDENGTKLLKSHPFNALENSEKMFDLNDIERDAIVNHMWPLTSLTKPKFKESAAVSISDKFCAIVEASGGSYKYAHKKAKKAFKTAYNYITN